MAVRYRSPRYLRNFAAGNDQTKIPEPMGIAVCLIKTWLGNGMKLEWKDERIGPVVGRPMILTFAETSP